jgi:ubiquinone/menaquinone biosynthesis C-methylase UbiE
MVDRAEPLDTTAAEAFEKFLVPATSRPLAEEVVRLAAPVPGERILDVACGTGIVIRLAAPLVAPGGTADGLDFDPAMIAVARAVVPCPDGVTLSWHCADAQQMPFEDATFDVVLCLLGLQYMPDRVASLSEMRRVIKPDGRLVLAVWTSLEDCKGPHAIAQALSRQNIDPAAILKAYSLSDADRLRELAHEAGFGHAETRTVSTTAHFPSIRQFVEGFAAGSISGRAAISKLSKTQRAEFVEDIQRALQQYDDGNGVKLPLGYLTLMARP